MKSYTTFVPLNGRHAGRYTGIFVPYKSVQYKRSAKLKITASALILNVRHRYSYLSIQEFAKLKIPR